MSEISDSKQDYTYKSQGGKYYKTVENMQESNKK